MRKRRKYTRKIIIIHLNEENLIQGLNQQDALRGFRDEGSMILPVLERIRGRVKGCDFSTEVLLELGVEKRGGGDAPSSAAVT